MSTVLRPFQTVLQTTRLDVRQWLTCTGVALSIIVVGPDQESGATTDCRQGCSRAA
jgi:hypothetical protein